MVLTIHAVPVENVWEVFVDHTSWNEWADQGVIKIEQTGSPTPNGVGCIKVTTSVGGDTTVEEVVGFEPIERLAYIVREGGYWTTDHTHEVFFDKGPNGKGCVVTWRCRFEPMVVGSGWIIENMVDKNYRTVLQLLEDYLSRSVPLDASGSDLVSGWEVV
ncbi:hypothetical protein, variant [Sphaeroforma arctica JP610]|uniref:Uncharacterized protein n=1 Tax=Sphaeroforma arctica JP610 TaxID=667725 RepID=A0A0L0FTZ8_9EUKA|nr:hypothetical protein, variant [Sphaeroforma arctica JP610]KNC80051.1 hypothetical protein, variant [Sphaeroforma arctica JP610]|eukprot:XP_014153953.1 hypothetical protein, variant [Sphaeroforma arctica JP610]